MSDEPYSIPDLASIDLTKSFLPSWARDSDASKQIARLAEKHDREERPDRGPRRRDDRGDRGPRGDRRPPRRDGDRREGRRADRSNDRREERQPDRGPQPLTGWDVQFLPDKHGVDGFAKQIRGTAKSYPLFDLAQLVLEKSERYLVEFKRASETAPALLQLKADGSLWLSEREAVTHALSAQLDKFYRRERIAVEPPKGVYLSVAVCGMSGVILGPSNYHDYQSKLIKLHAERFAHMPFEAFKSRVRMDRSEEAIAKWKEELSAKDVYYPIDLSKPQSPEPAPAADTEPTTAEPAEPAPEATAEPVEAAVEIPETEEAPTDAVEPEATPAEEQPVVEAPAAETRLESLEAVEAHFREHHAAKAIVQIRQRVIAPGSPVMNSSSPAVHTLTRGLWEQLRRFPLPLVHTLGQQLAARGVQIFKAHENITYASPARPKYLDRTAAPVSASLAAILDYLEANPKTPRKEQWKALLALRPAPAEGAEDQRETSLAADLLWLLHQGHVIDFARRNLEAARKPKPFESKPPKKSKIENRSAPAIAVADTQVEAAVAEPPVESDAAQPTQDVSQAAEATEDTTSAAQPTEEMPALVPDAAVEDVRADILPERE